MSLVWGGGCQVCDARAGASTLRRRVVRESGSATLNSRRASPRLPKTGVSRQGQGYASNKEEYGNGFKVEREGERKVHAEGIAVWKVQPVNTFVLVGKRGGDGL